MTVNDFMIKSLSEIQARLDEHRLVLENRGEGELPAFLDRCLPGCQHVRCLRETLLETIEALYESRKAFKSKQLEALRKKLIRVLADMP